MKDVANPPENLPVFCRRHAISITNVSKNYRDQLDVKVIGVTGSNGKTSTKDIVTSLLATKFKVQKQKETSIIISGYLLLF